MDLGNLTNIKLRTLTPLFYLKISQTLSLSELQIGKNGKWDEVPFSELKLSTQRFLLRERDMSIAFAKHNFVIPNFSSSQT